MKVLIIGGTGQISTAISRELLSLGADLTLYNRGQTPVRLPEGAKQIIGDRKQYETFKAQMAEAGTWDCVIDMMGFVPEDIESAIEAFKGRTKQFIFCSTVDTYLKPPDRFPVTEMQARFPPISQYGYNKSICEELLLKAHAAGDFKTTIIRPASTYGEGGRIIHSMGFGSKFVDRIRKGKPVIVHGDGQALWVSCHVDDCGHAFVKAINNKRAYGNAYHVTGEEWQTWDQYHYAVAEAMGAPTPKLVHIPSDLLFKLAPQQAEVTFRNFQYTNIFDNSAAKADLDFHYTIPFLEGARRVIRWMEENNRIDNSDDDPLDDRIIAAWERLSAQMIAEVTA